MQIPEDLQGLYGTVCGSENPDAATLIQLIERIASLEAALREKDEELKSTEEMLEAQQAKFDGCPHAQAVGEHACCGCSYDKPSDVCGFHAPQLRKAQEELAQARAENERLKELFAEYWGTACPDCGPENYEYMLENAADVVCAYQDVVNERNALRLKLEALSQPVSDEEWKAFMRKIPYNAGLQYAYEGRPMIDAMLAARAKQEAQ